MIEIKRIQSSYSTFRLISVFERNFCFCASFAGLLVGPDVFWRGYTLYDHSNTRFWRYIIDVTWKRCLIMFEFVTGLVGRHLAHAVHDWRRTITGHWGAAYFRDSHLQEHDAVEYISTARCVTRGGCDDKAARQKHGSFGRDRPRAGSRNDLLVHHTEASRSGGEKSHHSGTTRYLFL